jgi:hypothetical protein
VHKRIISAVKMVEFVSDRISYIILRGRWCHIVVMNESPDEKTNNQIDHILTDRGRHSSVFDVRSYRAADCDTDHYLVVAKARERLTKITQISYGGVQSQEVKRGRG